MKTIITIVGTSIFDNYAKAEVKTAFGYDNPYEDIGHQVNQLRKDNKFSHEYGNDIEELEETIQEKWFNGIYRKKEKSRGKIVWEQEEGIPNKDASAEIKSILAIAPKEEVQVHLIATDTVLSVSAALLIEKWFNQDEYKKKFKVRFKNPTSLDKQSDSIHVVKDLRVDDNLSYQKGFMNLIEILDRIIENKESEREFILNITSGYKAITPILTLYGQLKNVELNYIFDESLPHKEDQLIEIGNLPINFDWKMGELYFDFLTAEGLKKIGSEDYILQLNFLRKQGLIHKNRYERTILGNLFHSYIKNLLNQKKGDLGRFVELKLYEHFIKEGEETYLSTSYWWDGQEKYKESQQNEQNDSGWKKIEIDLTIKKEDTEDWFEVKSYSSSGLSKASKQLKKFRDFVKKTNQNQVKSIGLIFYKLAETSTASYHKRVEELQKSDIKCPVYFIDIPRNRQGLFNTKKFFEGNIELIAAF